MKRLLLFVVVAALACGKRGDPHAPVPLIPKATSDLLVTQRASTLFLQWSYPAVTTAGKSLPSIRRISIYRYSEELPATTPAGTATPVTDARSFGTATLLTAAQFAKLSHRVDSIEGANLPASSSGSKLVYEDSPPLHSSSGRPLRITYAVVTEGQTARSEYSNLASIVPLDAAVAPAGIVANAKPEGVVLTWTAPAASVTGAKTPAVVGYNVYRIAQGAQTDQFTAPLNSSPVTKTTYTDVPPYGTFDYRITAVAAAGPPRIESDPSAPVTATFKDLVPPPPPAFVTALVETNRVRLVWGPVDAPDLQGYNVYRTEKAGRVKFTYGLPIPQTNFEDISMLPGIEYYYSVTS
ncbi:MAG TPA: hypothetical protein VLU46_03030, partial [Thermoanaerobaculia bacterium]|nr:hypothetical protein [Thermoanaerobaculia bacterium]